MWPWPFWLPSPSVMSAPNTSHPPPLISSTSFLGKVARAAGSKTKDQEGRVSGAHRPQVPPAVVPGMLPSWVLVVFPPLGGAVLG